MTGTETKIGIFSPTTVSESTTTGLALINSDLSTVSADKTGSVVGVTENTLHTSTNHDGSTTVIPVLFGAPCLTLGNKVGLGGSPGAILLHGIGPGPGNSILPPVAGIIPPPVAIIQNGVPTPVGSGTGPEDSDEDENLSSTEDSSTTKDSSTTTSSTESETTAASYGLTTIVVDFERSDVTTFSSETATSGTAAASYAVTTIIVDLEPSDVSSFSSGTPTSGTLAASYGVTTVVVVFEAPTSTVTSQSWISATNPGETEAASYGITTIVDDYTPTGQWRGTSTAVAPTTLVTPTSRASESATEIESPLCVPYQDPREGSSCCQCSSDDLLATMPIPTTGTVCPWTAFPMPPTTTAPSIALPGYTFTAPDGAVIACGDYSTWGVGGFITATSWFEPSTTVSEAPGSTGGPKNCVLERSYFEDAECLFWIRDSTRYEYGSTLYIPQNNEPDVLWSDDESKPAEHRP